MDSVTLPNALLLKMASRVQRHLRLPMPEAEQPTRCDAGGMIRSTHSAEAIYSLITICSGKDRQKRHASDCNLGILGSPASLRQSS